MTSLPPFNFKCFCPLTVYTFTSVVHRPLAILLIDHSEADQKQQNFLIDVNICVFVIRAHFYHPFLYNIKTPNLLVWFLSRYLQLQVQHFSKYRLEHFHAWSVFPTQGFCFLIRIYRPQLLNHLKLQWLILWLFIFW